MFHLSEQTMRNIDTYANNAENFLTKASKYPVVGTLAGCTKVLMGGAQTLGALACAIIGAPVALVTEDSSLLKHSWTHIKHGLGNILAGVGEAIPIVQQVLYFIREHRARIRTDDVCIQTGQERKFMPYETLCDIQFASRTHAKTVAANSQYTDLTNAKIIELGAQQLTYQQRLDLAQQAANWVKLKQPVVDQTNQRAGAENLV